ncbi:hypothetical protein Tco_0449608 [Tanacetum coccineum]
MDHDHSDQLQADLAEASKKHRKRSDSPRTPSGSPPPPPPSPGAFGAPGASRASGSSQLPPPPPSSSSKPADSDKSKQKTNDSGALDSTKPPASALASTYQALTKNSLLEKTEDMRMFMTGIANRMVTSVRIDFSRPLPPLCKGSGQALSISKMKAARYPDFGLELLIHEHVWGNDVCTYDISPLMVSLISGLIVRKFYID